MTKKTRAPKPKMCAVPGCTNPADFVVYLEDFNRGYGGDGRFRKQDESCPFMCDKHAHENDARKTEIGRSSRYPFSKVGTLRGVPGWTAYQRLLKIQQRHNGNDNDND
jgi:hypothetical protein